MLSRSRMAWIAGLTSVVLVGCGSHADEEESVTAPNGSQPAHDHGDEEIAFQFTATEPRVGRVIVMRTLERRGLPRLETRIEWAIYIEPTDEGLRIVSRQPIVTVPRARLPEDVLNQLLIGRLFLASGVLDKDGIFRTNDGTADSVKDLQEALVSAGLSQLSRPQVEQFVN
ncbi:MAG: hypothetical protein KY476_12715, partial [Planctomycetes bacterium]|nr:hypothetical protein [Planctomycetota bacterium]